MKLLNIETPMLNPPPISAVDALLHLSSRKFMEMCKEAMNFGDTGINFSQSHLAVFLINFSLVIISGTKDCIRFTVKNSEFGDYNATYLNSDTSKQDDVSVFFFCFCSGSIYIFFR